MKLECGCDIDINGEYWIKCDKHSIGSRPDLSEGKDLTHRGCSSTCGYIHVDPDLSTKCDVPILHYHRGDKIILICDQCTMREDCQQSYEYKKSKGLL